MKKLSKDVYIETGYEGVVLGAVALEQGVVMIDAPVRSEDAQSWKKELGGLKGGRDRMIINLDAHHDRTLGVKEFGCISVAHEKTGEVFEHRPAVFKAQMKDSGSAWETMSGLSGIRWQQPEVTFKDRMYVKWGEMDVMIEHRPGPERGAVWVVLPGAKLVFVGDAVMVKEPPFLERADLKAWDETLDVLLSAPYKDYQVISGRSGPVTDKNIKAMKKLLKDLDKRLDRLGRKKPPAQETEGLVEKLVSNSGSPAKLKKMHAQRATYGLFQYFTKHYLSSSKKD